MTQVIPRTSAPRLEASCIHSRSAAECSARRAGTSTSSIASMYPALATAPRATATVMGITAISDTKLFDAERKNSRFMMVLAGTALAGAGLAQTSAHQSLPNYQGGNVTVQLRPIFAPPSLLRLIILSKVIVDGTVVGALPTITTSRSPGIRPNLETHSIVAVNSLFLGSIPGGSADILIAQVGGVSGNWNITAKGDPLLLPGERYIFFLVSDEREELPNTSGTPRYATVGIWSGRLKVTD